MSGQEGAPGLVTVVFVDVEGSTALLDSEGDDAGAAAVARQLSAVRERIAPYGGRETKSLGDGLLLTFASPRSAVSFALASQRALAGTSPRVRFGINTGEVLSADVDPIGGAVNAAARIAARAGGGEVLVSAVVRQLVGSAPAVRFVDRGRWRLKGFTERWHLYEAVDGTVSAGPATIGRTDALASIASLLASVASGSGAVLVLEGEAGIGKTHLVRAAIEAAKVRGLQVVETGADELEQRSGTIAHGLLAAVPDLDPSRVRLVEQLAPSADLDGGDRGFAICEACVDLVESRAGATGVLVVAEDLHWADDLSLRVVAALARRAGPSPVAVLATCRPSPRPTLLDSLLDRVGRAGEVIQLGPLAEIDVSALASAQLGAAPSPALRDRLAAAAGNPLFAGELLRSLEDDGHLRIDSGVAELTEAGLPADLRSTLIRRLSWLEPDVVELLRLASILGATFTLRDLAVITGRTVMDVAAQLHGASQAALVVGDGDRLAFRHDLIREAIYEDMALAVRQDLHRAAAEALAAASAPAAQVARQVALGARPGDLDAVSWLEQAAAGCAAVDPGTAIDLLERAIDLAPPDWAGRHRLRVRLIEPYARAGRFDAGRTIADAVLAASPDTDTEYAALRGLAAIYGNEGQIDAAMAGLHAAAAAPGAPPGAPEELRLLATQMKVTSGQATPDDRERIAATLRDGGGDGPLACLAHQALGFVDAVGGYEAEALGHFQAAAALLDAGQARWSAYLSPDGYAAATLLTLDRLDQAAAVADGARRRAERQAAVSDLPFMHLIIGAVPLFGGHLDEAAAHFEAGLSIVDDSGAANFALYLESGLAQIAIRRGDLDAAESRLAAGFARLASGTVRFGADWLMDTQSELLCARGQPAAALNLLETLWAQMAPARYFFGFRTHALRLVRLAHREGRSDLAAEVAACLQEAATRSPATSAAAAARRAVGILDRDPAAVLDSLALYRKTPLRPDLASCCEDAAAVLVEHDRRDEAIGLLDEARAAYADMGAVGDLARVDATTRQAGGRRRAQGATKPTVGWEALTAMERRVVELVARGLTNPEVGALLFVSRRTVETHLSHVFAKTGLTSRTQVAAEFVRRS